MVPSQKKNCKLWTCNKMPFLIYVAKIKGISFHNGLSLNVDFFEHAVEYLFLLISDFRVLIY